MRFVPLLLVLTLSGCSIIETISEGLSRFFDANDDGPRLTYADEGMNPVIRFAAITPDDKGLPLATNRIGLDGSNLGQLVMSPNAQYTGGDWDQFFFDGADFGIFIFNTRTGRREAFDTDNTLTFMDELACAIPAFSEQMRTDIADFIAVIAPDEMIDLSTLTFDVDYQDVPGNTLSFVGWTSDNQLVARYDYENGTIVTVPDPGFRVGPEEWGAPRLTGQIVYSRETDGTWTVDACPTSPPTTVTTVPEVRLTLRGGHLLRGDLLVPVALGDGFLTRGRTQAFSGAW